MVGIVVELNGDGIFVDFTYGKGKLCVEGKIYDVVLPECALLGEGGEAVALVVIEGKRNVGLGGNVIVDGEFSADGDVFLGNHHIFV